MAFENLRSELAELLVEKNFAALNAFENAVIDGIRSGRNTLAEGPEGCGKTTAALVSVLQKITEAAEGSPRAIIVCATDQKAFDLHAELSKYCRWLDLTVDLAHDRGNILQQRNDIFDGTEIIVATPKRLYELYIQNGFNVGKLKLLILDDMVDQFRTGHKMHLIRLFESLPKCQHLYFSTTFAERRTAEFIEEYLPIYQTIEA
jgi:superfamily II DNA/RNA helicase